MANDLRELLGESENQRILAQETLILEVSEAIWAALEKLQISKADLARSLSTSKANITQLLDGKRNMTLRSLADIAYALDLEPHFQLWQRNQTSGWAHFDIPVIWGMPIFSLEGLQAVNEGDRWSEPKKLSIEPKAANVA